MAREERNPAIPSKRTSSFLLRVWIEPSEGEKAVGAVRGYLRNLHTGEEQYIRDPEALTEVIRGQVRSQIDQASETGKEESKTRAQRR